jgi:hypothetical protein
MYDTGILLAMPVTRGVPVTTEWVLRDDGHTFRVRVVTCLLRSVSGRVGRMLLSDEGVSGGWDWECRPVHWVPRIVTREEDE